LHELNIIQTPPMLAVFCLYATTIMVVCFTHTPLFDD
jgi:hypothetical protein